MEITLNEKKLDMDTQNLSKSEVLQEIIQKIDTEEEIIKTLETDGERYDQNQFLSEGPELKEIDRLEIRTQKIEHLIRNTLLEAKDYLPKLENTIQDTIRYFARKDLDNANAHYLSCLDGLEWYSSALENIVRLVDSQDAERIKNLLNEFSGKMDKMLSAYREQDYQGVSQVMKEDVVETVNKFIALNGYLIEEYRSR